MVEFIKINPADNVAVALREYKKDEEIIVENVKFNVLNDIPKGHKIALSNIPKNKFVIKYGSPIGKALKFIKKGEHIHLHNLKTNLKGVIEYSYIRKNSEVKIKNYNFTFKGYKRSNGNVGIRNELWVIPTVGCVNGQAQQIVNKFKKNINYKNIDAVEVFKHPYGCSQLGNDHDNTKKALANLINHPNAGGVLVLGLGCENNQIDELKKILTDYDKNRVRFLVAQEVEDEIECGYQMLTKIYMEMKDDKRTDIPISELNIGLKCGGSDAFSGITANPLIGAFSDFLVAQGGKTILTEVPEMFGAENLLMERAINEQVFCEIVKMINDFKNYYQRYNLPIYENPSPGNKKGGISTLEEKALGCTQKGGKANVVDVLQYAETVKKRGLNLLYAPGNDLVASSALGFSGCQMVLFSTGRGTPFGSFVPTLKIATNTVLYDKKNNWIDFNAGTLVENKNFEVLLKEFVMFIIDVASGKLLKHEKSDFKEIAIFKTGVTL